MYIFSTSSLFLESICYNLLSVLWMRREAVTDILIQLDITKLIGKQAKSIYIVSEQQETLRGKSSHTHAHTEADSHVLQLETVLTEHLFSQVIIAQFHGQYIIDCWSKKRSLKAMKWAFPFTLPIKSLGKNKKYSQIFLRVFTYWK